MQLEVKLLPVPFERVAQPESLTPFPLGIRRHFSRWEEKGLWQSSRPISRLLLAGAAGKLGNARAPWLIDLQREREGARERERERQRQRKREEGE